MTISRALPRRSQVKTADTWDLSSLFGSDVDWEKAFTRWEKLIGGYGRFKGTLSNSAKAIANCLDFDCKFDRAGERLGKYAYLKTAEDTANSAYQGMLCRYRNAASRAAQEASFIRPEILSIGPTRMRKFLSVKDLAPFRLLLTRLLRDRPHTLTDREERLLAMQSEMAGTADQIFRQLNNADLRFGMIENDRGEEIELSHASYAALLHSPNREVRRRAFGQYYRQFAAHENTLAATLAGSIQRDIFNAKARSFESSREAALFPDNVPIAVYDNLIASVHRHLPTLYRYYELRRKKMKLKSIHHFDTYVPILSDLETNHSWMQACELVVAALGPLGEEYCRVLAAGLSGRWCDRYENQGKQSGAFSSGSYRSDPYILMNYKSNMLDHVFTLAHEAGHSMHSYCSARHQPYHYYNYTIFVAEVASTFNEQLLSRHLMNHAGDNRQRAFLINREIDSIRGTIVRQTMFAEFEKLTHELAERDEPLTLERFKSVYRELLEQYFGPEFKLDDELSLECFRIPHFYQAFYVYKYATGLSAAIALAERVTQGGRSELDDYLNFLKGGCSLDSLDLLRGAGVDMEKSDAVDTALSYFGTLVEQLEHLL
jgi:oligoendopeptidase F